MLREVVDNLVTVNPHVAWDVHNLDVPRPIRELKTNTKDHCRFRFEPARRVLAQLDTERHAIRVDTKGGTGAFA